MVSDEREEKLQKLDLPQLAELCGNVAHSPSVTDKQWQAAHELRIKWMSLYLASMKPNQEELEALKDRMVRFLAAAPRWMLPRFLVGGARP